MILPKDFFDKIDYWEHTIDYGRRTHEVSDKFTIHLKGWWRLRRIIKIQRLITECNDDGSYVHRVTESAADLYNQLNGYAIETFEEKLDKVSRKYEKHKEHNNVVVLKPRPKDLTDD